MFNNSCLMKDKYVFISSLFDDIKYNFYILINKKKDEVIIYNKKDNIIKHKDITNLDEQI